MFMLNSNEPIKVAHLKKLANQSMFEWCTCDRKQFIQWKQEKLWSFDIARNVLIEKKEIWAISTGFC